MTSPVTDLKDEIRLLIEVDFSDNPSSYFFHIKDAAAVWGQVVVNSVANKTGRSALEEGDRRTDRH